MTEIAIHISEGFPVLSYTLISEPLRVANRELGQRAFSWTAVSDTGGTVSSSSGIPLEAKPLPLPVPDAAILLASYNPDRAATPPTIAWLRRLDRAGVLLGCVDTGALVLARAGLLSRHPAAVHPEALAGFSRQFPLSVFIDRLFDFAPPRMSSAGGIATMDMTLALIAHHKGAHLARRVSDILTYEQRLVERHIGPAVERALDPALRDALVLMRGNLSEPLPISEIARRIGIPGWRLARLFKRYLRQAPISYYLRLRLERARDMLRNSALPIGEIANACGYENIEVFSRAYKAHFDTTPSRDRMI